MIDSINFAIRDFYNFDFRNLKRIGITPKAFQIEKKGFLVTGYYFKYNNIDFSYIPANGKVTVKTTTHKVLKKRDITLSDLKTYKEILLQTIKRVFNRTDVKLYLERIDYYVDIEMTEKMKKLYINLYRLYNPDFGHMKIKKSYKTSVYRQSGRGKYNLNMYSRFEFTKKEKDKNILRIELQMKKSKIEKELKQAGISRDLDNYWTKEAMKEYYFDFLEGFFGIGLHRDLDDAKLVIDNSCYSNKYKEKLKKFLEEMSLEIDEKELVKSKKYNCATIKKYKKMLGDISVNTLCVSRITSKVKVLPNLLDMARQIAEIKYFR